MTLMTQACTMLDFVVILRRRSLWSAASVAMTFYLPFFARIFMCSYPFILLSRVKPRYVGFEGRMSWLSMKMRGVLVVFRAMTSVFWLLMVNFIWWPNLW